MSEMPPNNSIVHHDYFSTDPKATKAFMEQMFGWKFSMFGEDYHMFEGPDGTSGGIAEPQPGMAPGNLNYVQVANLDETVKKAEKAGAKILMARQEVPGMGALGVFLMPGGVPQGVWENAKE